MLAELTLVVEQMSQLNTTMTTGLGKRDLAGFQQLDQRRPGYAQQIGCLLGGQQRAKRLQRHRFALTERSDCPDYDMAKLGRQMKCLARPIDQREIGITGQSGSQLTQIRRPATRWQHGLIRQDAHAESVSRKNRKCHKVCGGVFVRPMGAA